MLKYEDLPDLDQTIALMKGNGDVHGRGLHIAVPVGQEARAFRAAGVVADRHRKRVPGSRDAGATPKAKDAIGPD